MIRSERSRGVGLERLDAARLQRVDVVVVDRRDLGEDLVRRHHPQELGVGDALAPTASRSSVRCCRRYATSSRSERLRRPQAAARPPSDAIRVLAPIDVLLGRRVSALPRARVSAARPVQEEAGDRRDRVLAARARGGDDQHADDEPDQHVDEPRARMSSRISPSACPRRSGGAAARRRASLERPAVRRARSRASTTKWSRRSTSARTARVDALRPAATSSMRAEREALAALRGQRAAASSVEQGLAVREVAVDGRARDAGGGGDVAHARLARHARRGPRRPPSRMAPARPRRRAGAGARFGHGRLHHSGHTSLDETACLTYGSRPCRVGTLIARCRTLVRGATTPGGPGGRRSLPARHRVRDHTGGTPHVDEALEVRVGSPLPGPTVVAVTGRARPRRRPDGPRAGARAALAREPVVLDLGGTTFLDVAGVRLLVALSAGGGGGGDVASACCPGSPRPSSSSSTSRGSRGLVSFAEADPRPPLGDRPGPGSRP